MCFTYANNHLYSLYQRMVRHIRNNRVLHSFHALRKRDCILLNEGNKDYWKGKIQVMHKHTNKTYYETTWTHVESSGRDQVLRKRKLAT